jgi:ribosomal-protein-alanine N-acetyltransferase
MTMAWSGRIVPLTALDATALADLHARLFDPPWNEASFARLLAAETAVGLAATSRADEIDGALVAQLVAGEAEILTLMVDARQHRRGIGRLLLSALDVRVADAGAERIFLEVSVRNAAAVALYRSSGFVTIAERVGYYALRADVAKTALVMAKTVTASCVTAVAGENRDGG